MVKLADGLTFLADELRLRHPLVQEGAGRQVAAERAAELVSGTKLKDVAVRKKLYEGGKEAIDAANDPMIELARLVDPEARAVRKIIESEVEESQRQAYAKIAKVKFALEGTNTYPDATFTLRLAFGGQGLRGGRQEVPFETTFAGLYERSAEHNDKPPFDLPKRWIEQQGQARPEDAVQLRLHRRHHRRQLRQPGHQPARRGGRPDLRRQHPVAGAGLRLQREGGPRRVGPLAGHHRGAAQGLRRQRTGRRTDRRK